MTAVAQDDAAMVLDRYRKDPEAFVREVLGNDPWPVQVRILESVRDNVETAAPSCHSSGKTFIAARAVAWFLMCHEGALIVTTAPTKRQVQGILWKEIAVAVRDARVPLGGDLTTTQWKLDDDWIAMGFTAPEYDPNRFQGFHAPHLLIVEDEAAGISATIAEQIDSLMAGGHARRLKIGNPVDPYSPFKESCDDEDTETIPISAFDTPNFTEFGIEEKDIRDGSWVKKAGELPYPDLITPHWVARQSRRWTKDSPSWKARVLGEFPDEVEGAYFGAQMRRAARDDRICKVSIESDLPTVTAWDLGMDDEMAIWVAQILRTEVRLVDYYHNSGEGLAHYIAWLQRWKDKYEISFSHHYAPPDIAVRELTTGVSRLETAQRMGIRFTAQPQMGKADQIEAGRNLIGRCWFDKTRTTDGLQGLRKYRKEVDQKTGAFLPRPVHDEASHPADAFMVLAMGIGRDHTAAIGGNQSRAGRRGPGGL